MTKGLVRHQQSLPLDRLHVVLVNAREFATVAEAVADCALVVGTTAVGLRRRDHPLHALAEAAGPLRDALAAGKVALLFGSEKTGLSNQELGHCHSLLTIPMHRRHPANVDETLVRQLVRRMDLDRSRALAWTGILRQVLWKLQTRQIDPEIDRKSPPAASKSTKK